MHPDPHFIMLMGLPGSGKSAVARTLAGEDGVIYASDDIREEIFGDASTQGDNDLVFRELHFRVKRDLRAWKTVIYDATNLSYKRRKAFLRQLDDCKIPGLTKECILVYAPYEVCLERNRARERRVPEEVIRRMRMRFDPPMPSEGWDSIRVEYNCETEGAEELREKLSDLQRFPQDNPNHDLSLGDHMLQAMNIYIYAAFDTPYFDPQMAVAIAVHDIGKEYTKTFYDAKGNVSEHAHYYNHENVGAYEIFRYLRVFQGGWTNEHVLRVAKLIRWHMYPFVIARSQNPKKTKEKLKTIVGEKDYETLMWMWHIDKAAHSAKETSEKTGEETP